MSWEHTLLSTLVVQHLLIGAGLLLLLSLAFKLFKVSPEMKSWLWINALFAATLMPFFLLSDGASDDGIKVTNRTVHVERQVTDESGAVTQAPVTIITEQEPSTHWHIPSQWISDYAHVITAMVVIWALGFCWRALVLLRQYFLTRRTLNKARPWKHSLQHADLDGLDIYLSDSIDSPMVTGLRNPKILIPTHFSQALSEELLLPILLHEKAHMVRDDILIGLVQNVIDMIFWWSPVVRMMNRRVHINRELACDIRAANAAGGNKQYAQSLVTCARIMLKKRQDLLAMALFSRKKELNQRVETVLNNAGKALPTRRLMALLCAALTFTTMTVAQSFAPKINVQEVTYDAKPFMLLSRAKGEALINAVIEQDIDFIENMVDDGVDINTPAIGDGTALMIAVGRNDMMMVNALINMGADVNQSSDGDGNPLIIAAKRNYLRMANRLIEQGAVVNAIVPRDETALINASRNGHVEMVELLLTEGADPNLSVKTGVWDGYEVRSPMSMARSQAIRDRLIQAGATQTN